MPNEPMSEEQFAKALEDYGTRCRICEYFDSLGMGYEPDNVQRMEDSRAVLVAAYSAALARPAQGTQALVEACEGLIQSLDSVSDSEVFESVKQARAALAAVKGDPPLFADMSGQYPPFECLRILADFADHILKDHNYDGLGWERISLATNTAKEHLSAIYAAKAEPVEDDPLSDCPDTSKGTVFSWGMTIPDNEETAPLGPVEEPTLEPPRPRHWADGASNDPDTAEESWTKSEERMPTWGDMRNFLVRGGIVGGEKAMAISFNYEHRRVWMDYEGRYYSIAVLTPLAEEGRKHLVRRLAALELIESGAYHPKRLNPEIGRDIGAAFGDGEIVNVADGISPWFELTDKGRERLVYLRGLVGEEKAECQQ